MTNIMAFNVHNSGFFHTIPVATQNKQAKLSIMILSGYTSKLVNVTPIIVMMFAPHPISLLLFLKNVNYLSHG
jgi:hypothetical protein